MTLILRWVCEIFFSVISKNHLSVKTVLSSLREHVGEFEMKSQISPQFVIFTHSHLQTSVFLNPPAAADVDTDARRAAAVTSDSISVMRSDRLQSAAAVIRDARLQSCLSY